MCRRLTYLPSFNTIQNYIDLKRADINLEYPMGFNTIQNYIDLKLTFWEAKN